MSVDTGALKDPTTPLRGEVERAEAVRDELIAERDRYSKASDEYQAADVKVKEAEGRFKEATSTLQLERKRLNEYLEIHRSFEAAVEAKSVTQFQRAHDAALNQYSQQQTAGEWEKAILAIELVIESVGEMSRIEKEYAAALASARARQIETATALKKEAMDSQLAARRAEEELKALKAKMEEADARIRQIEAREAKETSEAERAYAAATKDAKQKRGAMSTAPEPKPAPAPKPTPTPSRQSFFSRQTENNNTKPKVTPLPSLTQPWVASEVDRAWEVLLDSAELPTRNRPPDLRISRADFVRSVNANPELTRVFSVSGTRALRQLASSMDVDRNESISKDEFSTFLRFPSARRSASNTGDAASAFDAILCGVERVRGLH
jgi:hypothetical protein